MKRATITLAAALALLLSAGCGSTSGGDFNLVSLEEEWQLGNQLAADIARQMPLVQNASANSYINRLGQQLVAQTEMRQLPWNFHIVDDPQVNAFNIPGGHVYVTTGLIGAADNAAELAGVMSHEIAHGVERHATEQMTRQYGLSLLASVALGQDPAAYQQILAQVLGTGALASFGRDAERESDILGTRYMFAAGYNPEGMVTMFQELLSRRKSQPNAVSKFFSTHPLEESRIDLVRSEIARLGARSNLVMNTNDFRSFQQAVAR